MIGKTVIQCFICAFILMLSISSVAESSLNTIENEFIKIVMGKEGFDYGRFSIETTGGDPSRDTDDNVPLIYGRPKPWTSYTTVAIDDIDFGVGVQTVKRAGKSARYGQITSSKFTKDSMVIVNQMEDVKVIQSLSFFRNPLTNVQDSVLIEYELINESDSTKNIGIRIMMDTMLGKNDAAPFRIGDEAIVAEKAYQGDQILDFWQTFDSLATPNIIGQGILRYMPAKVSPPDQMILMNWGTLADEPFQVSVEEGRSFIRDGENEPDTALALLWNKVPLGPKQSRVYRTVMGLGGVSLAPGDLAMGLTAPSYLAITDPNEYLIIAYLSNTGGFTVKNAMANLVLPKGMSLIKGDTRTDLGTMMPNGSRQLVYKVKMNPKEAKEGKHKIQIKVDSETLDTQSINRDIQFTGQPKILVSSIGEPYIERGMDQFIDVPIQVLNKSEVIVSNIMLVMDSKSPLILPDFELKSRRIPVLMPYQAQKVSWKLKVSEWKKGVHNMPVKIFSEYTKPETVQAKVKVGLGKPKAKLYYSEPSIFIGEYGYVWIVLLDMPTFSGLDLKLTWNDEELKSIRVSPEPWLIEQEDNVMEMFTATSNALQISNLSAQNPPWRTIIGKWHFKALLDGDAKVTLWQDDERLDTLKLVLRNQEAPVGKEKEENGFDF